jgi:cyclopropane-fatty-acyl-phospholipid synthase
VQGEKTNYSQAALPGARVIDVGCGWGGMMAYCADELGAAHVEGITLSAMQHEHIT